MTWCDITLQVTIKPCKCTLSELNQNSFECEAVRNVGNLGHGIYVIVTYLTYRANWLLRVNTFYGTRHSYATLLQQSQV